MSIFYLTLLLISASLRSPFPFTITIASLNVCQGFNAHPLKLHSRRQYFLGMSKLRERETVSVEAIVPDHTLSTVPSEDTLGTSIAQTLEAITLFDKWDTDGTGTLGIPQLSHLLSELFPDAVWNKQAVERLASEDMNMSNHLIEFVDFYSWFNLQAQSNSHVNNIGNRHLVVTHNSVNELSKHFGGGKSSLGVRAILYKEIQSIIGVSYPYYALENERILINDLNKTIGFVAEVSPEMPVTYKAGLIGLAETCR